MRRLFIKWVNTAVNTGLARQGPSVVRPSRRGMKPSAVDKLGLWLSTSRTIDGLWVGSFARDWENERGENEREITLRRVEDALHLIKLYDPLSYSRVTRDLKRIWVNLVPHADACYERSLQACVFDER